MELFCEEFKTERGYKSVLSASATTACGTGVLEDGSQALKTFIGDSVSAEGFHVGVNCRDPGICVIAA